MTTIAIIGAGRGLGAAVARRFGAAGFAVGLVSRSQAKLDALAEELAADGVQARGFAADVRDPVSLARALEQVTETLGPIEFSVYGPVAAVHQVLPGMRFLGENRGTILFVNGGSAVTPGRGVTGTSVAFAAQAAYAQLLHEVLGEEGIQVSQLIIPGKIVPGDPEKDPDVLAGLLWDLHSRRDRFRHQVAGTD